jgi:hypothetical protein
MSLQADCAEALPEGHSYGPLVFILGACAVVGIIGLLVAAQNNAMWAELRTRATGLGWTEVPREEVPPEIAHLVQWHRPRCILRGPGDGDVLWLVWHQWTTRRGKSRTTHNATRLLATQRVDWRDFTVERRTRLGAKLMPVNGAGTGDREFDRAYLIRTGDPADTPVVLTPDIRAALVREEIVPFAVAANLATILVRQVPDVDLFDAQTPVMARVVALLARPT